MRVGWGFDAHRFGDSGRVLLGGVEAAADRGVVATSDGDVLAHAVADALLGAAALGDLGTLFPSTDPQWVDADSMDLLRQVVERVHTAGFIVSSLDATVIAERIRVAPHRAAIRLALAVALDVAADRVSVKATSTDGMGFLGNDEGLAATALVVIEPAS